MAVVSNVVCVVVVGVGVVWAGGGREVHASIEEPARSSTRVTLAISASSRATRVVVSPSASIAAPCRAWR